MPLMGDKAIDIVDIKEYVGIVLKRKWLVMACFIVCLGTMTVILMLQQPTYVASAKIQTASGMELRNRLDPNDSRGRPHIANAVEVLKSEEMAQRALNRVIPK